ncbi:hypothetical protein V5O48_010921, partial [Marasmius crinis-equi]
MSGMNTGRNFTSSVSAKAGCWLGAIGNQFRDNTPKKIQSLSFGSCHPPALLALHLPRTFDEKYKAIPLPSNK